MTELSNGPWRMLVVDDDPLIATLVAEGLRTHRHTVTVASTTATAQQVLAEADPHVLICDLNFIDGQSGAEFIAEVRAARPWIACVVLSTHRSPELAVPDAHVLPNDVVYLVKSTVQSIGHLLDAVQSAMTGRALENPAVPTHDEAVLVNGAQAEVLRMLAAGASTRAVAEARGTSIRAVESLLVRLYTTLGLDTSRDSNPRVEAVRLWQAGQVSLRRPSGTEGSNVR